LLGQRWYPVLRDTLHVSDRVLRVLAMGLSRSEFLVQKLNNMRADWASRWQHCMTVGLLEQAARSSEALDRPS
jgi:hypothetical protein